MPLDSNGNGASEVNAIIIIMRILKLGCCIFNVSHSDAALMHWWPFSETFHTCMFFFPSCSKMCDVAKTVAWETIAYNK